MSSGSKGPDKGHGSEAAQKRELKLTAEKIVEDRELRNTRAKANMMLYEQKKALAPKVDEDFEEPGMALQLLKKEEKEYGGWAGDDDPHGLQAAMEHDDGPGMDEDLAGEEGEEEQDALPDDEAEAEPTDESAKDEGANDGAEAAEPTDKGADDAPMGDWYSKGKQRGHKGGKGKWQQKPWWAKAKWSSQSGRGGRKGQGKGVYDAWGGEYCHGGYRAVNGQFYPHLDCISLWLDVTAV